MVYKSIHAVSSDIGYTPGTVFEKLEIWYQSIFDNLEVLFSSSNGDKWKQSIEMFMKKGKIRILISVKCSEK